MRRVAAKVRSQIRRQVSGWNVWLVAMAFAVLGAAIILSAQAANLTVQAEAETGKLAGRAGTLASPNASGGSFVTFGVPRSYVAIGDSVASGDGIEYGWKWTPDGAGDGDWVRTGPAAPLWEPTGDTRPEVQACHRSKRGYPYLVAAKTNDKLYNVSCSGASVLEGVLNARHFSSTVIGAAQVGSAKPGYALPNPGYDAVKPDIVSITLGMNDIVFTGVLKDCYLGTTCVTPEADQGMNQRIATFKVNLELLLAEIKDRGTATEKVPKVVLTNYYDPFHPDSSKQCNDTYIGLGNGLGANEIDWIRTKLELLNRSIAEAAATYPKSKVADISKALAGHEFCSGDPWVYGISIWYNDFGSTAPYHPTPEAQIVISKAVTSVIDKL